MKVDTVFEGGGVKGIGLIGAVCCLEEKGYEWNRFAGTSAGAIIASLLAAGYSGRELKDIMMNLDYKIFLGKNKLKLVSIVSKSSSLLKNKGIYSGEPIRDFVRDLLIKKNKIKFRDVSINGKSKLKIIASDITQKNMLILPEDIARYGIDPMEFEIAEAVRMSLSIPFYFKPIKFSYKDGYSYIVDGGLLSNFPIWIFDVQEMPRWPTFGFKLVEERVSYTSTGKTDFISFLLDVVNTMIDKNEEIYIKDKDAVRTIFIPTLGVSTTDFNITKEMRLKIFQSGYKSAEKFLNNWSFSGYVKEYRSK
ncbi:patatin-like phospholipase family protein [Clostridium sp. CX1]|uniref:Patatin-like phospholipase family protein n=1 Tax=Clostridium tanneri TaxID=3037988 RepID=A0ABU4JV05_9CLOT|nr:MULTISPECIES: patatin-like phospholipase family protein [unclassified Clostridium]MCT8975570.1 patatin-like phospholipase family protein [Clostridium sp. CX1]MDW8801970.1 patatin-like phospholipase family protein [Clostridium sp. A1-XYC3]